MRLSLLIFGVLTVGLSGCATVDFAEMAPQRDVVVEIPIQKNVAIRSAETLDANFTRSGWAAGPDANRMQKAANVLLRGIGKPERVIDNSYAAKAKSIFKVRQDIAYAAKEVNQALKAAEVFLAMAPDAQDLQSELAALEKALGTCHKAELMFLRALEKVGAKDVRAEIEPLKSALDQLKATANLYGDRVRAQAPVVGGAAS